MKARLLALRLFTVLTTSLLIVPNATTAQTSEALHAELIAWVEASLHPITHVNLDGSTAQLQPLDTMIGDARIIALSEAIHAGTEPLEFRNLLFKHLAEERGIRAIALESGIIESRVLNDYVTKGIGELEIVLQEGFGHGFGDFKQNHALIQWIKQYNDSLSDTAKKIQIFGFDISGSPGNLSVARSPDTAIAYALHYLQTVDSESALSFAARMDKTIALIKGTNPYGMIPLEGRDSYTSAIVDLIALIERRQIPYTERSSELEYAWALQAAHAARDIDNWFRLMPKNWTVKGSFDWTLEGIDVRDRAMIENIDWILSRLEPEEKLFVFASVAHIAMTPMLFTGSTQAHFPFGAYAKQRYGRNFVNIMNFVEGGEIAFCNSPERPVMKLQSPPPESAESIFASTEAPRYFVDLRKAPSNIDQWLRTPRDHWNGFGSSHFAIANAFDIAYFVSPITSDCAP